MTSKPRDTEHNGRRTHDYKSNRENKKSDDNNKEKKNSNKLTYQQTLIIKTCTF